MVRSPTFTTTSTTTTNTNTASFSHVFIPSRQHQQLRSSILDDSDSDDSEATAFNLLNTRRDMIFRSLQVLGSASSVSVAGVATTTIFPTMANAIDSSSSSSSSESENDTTTTVPVLKTSSGLKYIDIVPGTGISPMYGNLCSISYTAYVKLPTSSSSSSSSNTQTTKYSTKPQKYDHCDGYLIKHGNGRMIAGLDEGLHTMKVGGTRRLLIPPKLGFVDVGLGPLPDMPWNRNQLNQLLDQMIELSGGTMIYEVTLLSVIPDEADLGYYTDASLSPQDFATLRENLRISGNEGRIQEQAEEMAANTIKGQDRLL